MARQTVTLEGGDKVDQVLQDILQQLDAGPLAVGFMENATYPDGTPVAAVAFWNEFGGPERPPRPFFRRMIAKESPGWGVKLAKLAKLTNYNGSRALGMLGQDIADALGQSIIDFTSPPLAASTIAAKGFAKPLIDTSHMKNSITYKVGE